MRVEQWESAPSGPCVLNLNLQPDESIREVRARKRDTNHWYVLAAVDELPSSCPSGIPTCWAYIPTVGVAIWPWPHDGWTIEALVIEPHPSFLHVHKRQPPTSRDQDPAP